MNELKNEFYLDLDLFRSYLKTSIKLLEKKDYNQCLKLLKQTKRAMDTWLFSWDKREDVYAIKKRKKSEDDISEHKN